MKTPEEIKKGLECRIRGVNEKCDYRCDKCDVYIPGYNLENRYSDSLAYIRQLESRLAQVERERDACVFDMRQFQGVTCNACKHHYRPQPEVRHYECDIFGKFSDFLGHEEGPLMCGKFEWRGVCPENTKEADSDGKAESTPDP